MNGKNYDKSTYGESREFEPFISKPWEKNDDINDNCSFSPTQVKTILLQLKHSNRFTIDIYFNNDNRYNKYTMKGYFKSRQIPTEKSNFISAIWPENHC